MSDSSADVVLLVVVLVFAPWVIAAAIVAALVVGLVWLGREAWRMGRCRYFGTSAVVQIERARAEALGDIHTLRDDAAHQMTAVARERRS